jgi:3-methyladenine DNA glycosylase AlkD
MDVKQALKELKSKGNPTKKNLEGMARFGINVDKVFCTSIPEVRKLAKKIGKDHKLALELWKTGYSEARILAGSIDDPELVTEKQMEEWVNDFNCWTVCVLVCSNLFDKTKFCEKKIIEWSKSKKEFVKRAGFVLMASSAVHDKKSDDKKFLNYFAIIKRESTDERNFVRKAVNWALRGIGKRNIALNSAAIKCAEDILKTYPQSKSARWIANDALRELKDKRDKKLIKK